MQACRTCLSKHHLRPIFGTNEFNSDELFLVTGVRITPNDGLPQTACNKCMKMITNSLYLRDMSSKAEKYLKTITTQSMTETEQCIEEMRENTVKPLLNEVLIKANEDDINDLNDIIKKLDVEIPGDVTVTENADSIAEVKNDDEPFDITEFVMIKPKPNLAETDKDKSKSRNCLQLSNDAQIVLYPNTEEFVQNSDNILGTEPIDNLLQPSTIILCPGLDLNEIPNATVATDSPNDLITSDLLTNEEMDSEMITDDIMDDELITDELIPNEIIPDELMTNEMITDLATADVMIDEITSSDIANETDKLLNEPEQFIIPGQDSSADMQIIKEIIGKDISDVPAEEEVSYETEITPEQLCDLNIEKYLSKKDLRALFRDAKKFGKQMEKAKKSDRLNNNSKKVDKKPVYNRKTGVEDQFYNDKGVKAPKKTGEDDMKDSEELIDSYEDLYGDLMLNLKQDFESLQYIPEDLEESSIMRKSVKSVKPSQSDPNRKKYLQERTQKLMSLAVIPHNKDGPIECSICHEITKTRNSFKNHALIHFEREHMCQFEGCGKKFVHRGQLRRHEQAVHGVEKRFSCTQCAYTAADRDTMKNHIRSEHTGVRPFECNECGVKFLVRNHIVQHMLVHFKAAKKVQCELCPARFTCRRDLWIHQDKSHFYTYKFYCYLCPNTYASGAAARKHITKLHGVPKIQQLKLKWEKFRKPEAPNTSKAKQNTSKTKNSISKNPR